ncbi:hypothetical protein C4K37_5400 [Pseudomonas chlororaphis subsp. piscium]|nr:hypothetical protein C4K37_5400 [Pseudomonas chlororaphis subsp. piscium]AZC46315.1 hypothetical protein C4K36_5414 [Pseudomonas chlororaphis subsp. piscium]
MRQKRCPANARQGRSAPEFSRRSQVSRATPFRTGPLVRDNGASVP